MQQSKPNVNLNTFKEKFFNDSLNCWIKVFRHYRQSASLHSNCLLEVLQVCSLSRVMVTVVAFKIEKSVLCTRQFGLIWKEAGLHFNLPNQNWVKVFNRIAALLFFGDKTCRQSN